GILKARYGRGVKTAPPESQPSRVFEPAIRVLWLLCRAQNGFGEEQLLWPFPLGSGSRRTGCGAYDGEDQTPQLGFGDTDVVGMSLPLHSYDFPQHVRPSFTRH